MHTILYMDQNLTYNSFLLFFISEFLFIIFSSISFSLSSWYHNPDHYHHDHPHDYHYHHHHHQHDDDDLNEKSPLQRIVARPSPVSVAGPGLQAPQSRLIPDNDDHNCDTDYNDDHGVDGNHIKLRENIWLQKKGNPR